MNIEKIKQSLIEAKLWLGMPLEEYSLDEETISIFQCLNAATKQALSESCCDHNKSSYTFGSVKFNTYAFPTKDEANTFMQTPQGQQYGFIGMDDKGQFHVAHMDDNGETLA